MNKTPASIFNNILGPVMRGPSSSHTAAALRIGNIASQLLGQEPAEAVFTFDPDGSLATTYLGQGSAMGLAGGLLGLSMTDPALSDWKNLCKKAGLKMKFKIERINAAHPNTYQATIRGKDNAEMSFTALSTGGGSIRITEVNGIAINFNGTGYEIIAQFRNPAGRELILNSLKSGKDNRIIIREAAGYIHLHSANKLTVRNDLKKLKRSEDIVWISSCNPVMPVIINEDAELPFKDIYEFTSIAETRGGQLSDYAIGYEALVGNLETKKILRLALEYLDVVKKSISTGLNGTAWSDRILPSQSPLINIALKSGKLIPGELINEIISSVTAIMETKSSMGVILAAPTAGSCGTIGGVLIPAGIVMKKNDRSLSRALLAAGLFGVFISDITGFAAEEGGCQYECGAASGMAAAALADLAGGDAATALRAGSLALQNIIGMVCDPVAGRVEIPCLGKNVMAAFNALSSANMALAGFDPVIPAGEVIETMKAVGCSMPRELRCTGKGGLSVTPSAKKITRRIKY
jgi:L-serine dehydratase